MARPIYLNKAAESFRAAIRPAMFGRIGQIENNLSTQAAIALGDWMLELVQEVIRTTKLKDRKGEVYKQLMAGIRIYGRSSLRSLRGQINVQPWLIPHEFGATIKPENVEYLTIPIFFGLRADGSPKFRSARSWQRFGSFVYKDKKTDKLYLAYKSKQDRELKILYILVDKVEIPASLNIHRIADATLGTLMATWGAIWVREAAIAGILNPWEGHTRTKGN